MKTTAFSLLLLFFISVAFSQTKSIFSDFKKEISPTLFNKDETTTTVLYTSKMAGKTTWNTAPNAQSINLNPKNFSWYKDARRLERYRESYISSQNQNVCGPDIPLDFNKQLIQSTYSKDIMHR